MDPLVWEVDNSNLSTGAGQGALYSIPVSFLSKLRMWAGRGAGEGGEVIVVDDDWQDTGYGRPTEHHFTSRLLGLVNGGVWTIVMRNFTN